MYNRTFVTLQMVFIQELILTKKSRVMHYQVRTQLVYLETQLKPIFFNTIGGGRSIQRVGMISFILKKSMVH
jgi:hypothetical protein